MSTIKVNTISPRNTGETISVNGIALPNAGTLANRNKIINGDMSIAQRGAPTGTDTYPADRFRQASNTEGAYTFARETTDVPTGFNYSLKATVTTADGTTGSSNGWVLLQKIEGYNAADLLFGTANAKSITITFWVKSSVAGVYCATLRNGADNRCFVSEYTISSADTWEYKTITVAGDTSGTWETTNGSGLGLVFCLTGGSSKQRAAGSWGAFADCSSNQTQLLETLNANWLVTGVQLEAGTNATPFEHRNYGDELARCERYYQEQLFFTNSANFNLEGDGGSGAYQWGSLLLPTTMRSSPTTTFVAVSGAGISNVQETSLQSFSPVYIRMYIRAQSSGRFYGGIKSFTADAEL